VLNKNPKTGKNSQNPKLKLSYPKKARRKKITKIPTSLKPKTVSNPDKN
jgi:hypothetical protein